MKVAMIGIALWVIATMSVNLLASPQSQPSMTPPSSVQLHIPSSHTVTLQWTAAVQDPNASPTTGYIVKRAYKNVGPYYVIAYVAGTSYVDKTVAPGTTYFYVVDTVSASIDTAPVKAVVPTP